MSTATWPQNCISESLCRQPSPILRTHGCLVGEAICLPQPGRRAVFLNSHVRTPTVGDGALDVPFRMPSMPVHECRGGYQPPARNLPHCTAPPPFPRVRTVPRPPCAKEAVSEADWRIVLLKSRHFPVFQIAPCRGRYFLVRQESTQRTDPGRRFKCGLSTVGRKLSILPRPQSALPWVPLPPLRVS